MSDVKVPASFSRRDLLKRWWSTQKTAAVAAAGAATTTVRAAGQAMGFGAQEAAHLWRRVGFGGTPDEIQALVALGRAGAVDSLINYENVDNDAMEQELNALVQDVPRGERADRGRIDLSRFPGLQAWWLFRMANTARQLEEKLTLFWHGHFATAVSKVNRADYMLNQNQLFREMALGNFEDILLAVSRDPAMILWLDNNTNIKDAPNENYARELMELFSMGIEHAITGQPNYTETDIQEVARAFTGWTVRRQGFFFNRNQHDFGEKTIFGQTADFNGEGVVALIAGHDATAYFMSKKFWEFFAYENPETAVLDELAGVYFDSGYDIKAMLTYLFNMDAFYSDKAVFSQIKSPAEFAVGALRQLGIKFNDARGNQALANFMRTMDQDLFNPPTVAGWDGGLDWINTATLLVRYNTANTITSFNERRFGQMFDPNGVVEAVGQDAEALVDALLVQLGPLAVSDGTRFLLVDYLTDGDLGGFELDPRAVENKVRGVTHLIMSLPEYQLN